MEINKKITNLIIGEGEVGTALYNVLKTVYPFTMFARDTNLTGFDLMHICFSYDENFVSEVKRYQNEFRPRITVIHSTVPVGTSRKLNACHSPIVGKHPSLEDSIRTFVKFVGGRDADEVAQCLGRAGLKVQICRKSETTELAKLLDTLYYGACIEYAKEAERMCNIYDVPFNEVYTLFNQNYNQGYQKLGYPEYTRPILQPIQRKIGGHCVVPNLSLIKSKFADFIRNFT